MVLSDVEIWTEINAERLVFDPPVPGDRIGSSSVDLLLHDELIVLPQRQQAGIILDPSSDADFMNILRRNGEIASLITGPHTLMPGTLVIGKTLETIYLPPHIAGRIEGKSTLARLGLAVHVTAPTVLAGFEGRLYLEMHTVGPFPLSLTNEMNIAQLVLEHTGLPPSNSYAGRFQSQE